MHKVADATWRFNEAFLFAYEGDLENAYRSYRRAMEAPFDDPTLPAQCEEFIQAIIEREPEKRWLYFCLGLINHRVKGDLMAAKLDYQHFLDGN